MTKKTKRNCVLCEKAIGAKDSFSSYRVAGTIRGFEKNIDMEKAFHNECLTIEEGINEVARAQILDYLEAMEFNRSVMEDLRGDNLQRAKKFIQEMEWRQRHDEK
tara:strand:- start:152 stop:466 length:315 start_codon:yes stop_codon:yes gene_type:complete